MRPLARFLVALAALLPTVRPPSLKGSAADSHSWS
jgi:hypothetical protein